MRRASSFLAPLSLLGSLAFLLLAPRAARADDLVVIQQSNGFLGSSEIGNVTTQKVEVQGERLRIWDADASRAVYACLDKKVVFDVDALTRQYVERPVDYFTKLRSERARRRAERVATSRAEYDRADDEGKRRIKQALSEDGLDLSGEAKAQRNWFPDDKKTASVVVEGKRRIVELAHWEIRQLGARKPAFDFWIAPTLGKRAGELFKFWKELAVFSDTVNAELAQVEGLPVLFEVNVDDGSGFGWKKLEGKILEIRSETLDKATFELPAGFKKVEKPEGPADLTCAVCAKPFKNGSGKLFRDPTTRRAYDLCSEDCLGKCIENLAAGLPPSGKPGPQDKKNEQKPK